MDIDNLLRNKMKYDRKFRESKVGLSLFLAMFPGPAFAKTKILEEELSYTEFINAVLDHKIV